MTKEEIGKGYAEFIKWASDTLPKEDQLFINTTFRFGVSEETSEKEVKACMGRLSESLREKTGRKLRWICVTEKQDRGALHSHILAIGEELGQLSRKKIKQRIRKELNSKEIRVLSVKEGLPYYMSKDIPFGAEVSLGGYWPPNLRFEPTI